MQTLAPPTPIWPELSIPSCEQVMPGNATEDEQDGKIGSGLAGSPEPEPLQGGGDDSDETGSEGDGT